MMEAGGFSNSEISWNICFQWLLSCNSIESMNAGLKFPQFVDSLAVST